MDKVKKEMDFFTNVQEFEQPYGWSWFLKLHHELKSLGDLDKVRNTDFKDDHDDNDVINISQMHLKQCFPTKVSGRIFSNTEQ